MCSASLKFLVNPNVLSCLLDRALPENKGRAQVSGESPVESPASLPGELLLRQRGVVGNDRVSEPDF